VKRKSRTASSNDGTITVSIGVPAYNEEKTIQRLLGSILEQREDSPNLKEIIVNTTGSTDHTAEKAQSAMRTDSRVKLISGAEREGKATALNSILRKARGSVVLFVDADAVLERDALSKLVRPLIMNEKIGICSGNTMPMSKDHTFFHFASLFIRSLHHEMCAYLSRRGATPKVNGSFYAIRRDIVSAFPRQVVSDDEYASVQAQKKGYEIVYVPDAMIYTRDPSTFSGFLRWQSRIIAGQMFMKRQFNYEVPTLSASVAVPGLLKLLKMHRRRVMSLFALASLGALSFLLAYVTFLRNKVPYVY
jgi:cellulose synthase/poly-beta-1,6-N-acetylglucosamine synthase-like glycosyltransferase